MKANFYIENQRFCVNICTDFPHPAGQAAFATEDRPAKKLKTTLDKSRLYAIITERS